MEPDDRKGTSSVPVTPSYVKMDVMPQLPWTTTTTDESAYPKRIAAKQLSASHVPEREKTTRVGSWVTAPDSRRLQDLNFTRRSGLIQPKSVHHNIHTNRTVVTPLKVNYNANENTPTLLNVGTKQRLVPLNKHRSESFIDAKLAKEPQHPFMSHVLDYLYVGSVDALYCEPLLCRLHVQALVDVTNTRPTHVPPHRKTLCPCTCPLQIAHPRSRLSINIDDRDDENIVPYFEEVNKFINSARSTKRNVLVFSMEGNSRGPALVVQYLMQMEHMCFSTALQLVTSVRPTTKINPGFLNTLKRLEHANLLSHNENNLPEPETRKTKLFRWSWRKPDREAVLDVHPNSARSHHRLKHKPFLKSSSMFLNSLPSKFTHLPFNSPNPAPNQAQNSSLPEITWTEPLTSSNTCLISEDSNCNNTEVQVLHTKRVQAWA